MLRAIFAVLLQFPLIVLTNDVGLSETNNRDSTAQTESTLSSASFPESTKLHSSFNESSTISGIDKNSTENVNRTTESPQTTTTDPQLLLIPPATVEAQIDKANISSKKTSRLQVSRQVKFS